MNPLVVKIGVCVVASAAAFIFFLWKNGRNNPASYPTRALGDFDGSNINICCICLNEFLGFNDKNQIVSLPCKHKFHQECIKIVFSNEAKYRRLCPLCRSLVSEMFITRAGLSE